jgi:hypothetical protein
MCVQVNVRGQWCHTVGELRKAVPCDPIKESCYKKLPNAHQCLCGVDAEATLNATGVEWIRDDCGDYHVGRPTER